MNGSATCHDLLLEKGDGTFELVVWNERLTGSDAVTVDLGGVHASVKVYDTTAGTSPTMTLTQVSQVPLTLDDRAFVLEFR
jgi:hypothetical protein